METSKLPTAAPSRKLLKRYLEAFDRNVLGQSLRFAIRVYQLSLGLLFAGACRFEPSCSRYSEEAITKYGGVKGTWMTIARLSRCHPFCRGGIDPVP